MLYLFYLRQNLRKSYSIPAKCFKKTCKNKEIHWNKRIKQDEKVTGFCTKNKMICTKDKNFHTKNEKTQRRENKNFSEFI